MTIEGDPRLGEQHRRLSTVIITRHDALEAYDQYGRDEGLVELVAREIPLTEEQRAFLREVTANYMEVNIPSIIADTVPFIQ